MNGSGDNSFIVKLRGLPFTTTAQEVMTFLSGVNILNEKDGKTFTGITVAADLQSDIAI